MRLRVSDLLDQRALSVAVAEGYVRGRPHPTAPLVILNYTEKAQYEHVWNDVTSTCRGLIYDTTTAEVVARPWRKFFNYGQHPEGALDLSAPVQVTDKMDGSLGILYPADDGPAIATRGSFASDQALHATALYRAEYANTWTPRPGLTYLFEIVYPENRIVLDYGNLDDLVLLGAVDTQTGQPLGPDYLPEWPGPRTDVFEFDTLADALAAPPRTNAEGLVVRFRDSGLMVKIKQEDYVALHKLVTGLNARVVWERLGAGETVADLCAALPDEFHAWVREVADGLARELGHAVIEARTDHLAILDRLPAGWTRRDYAMEAAKSPHRPWLFNLLDGRDPGPGIWKTLKPGVERTLVAVSEDVA